MAANEMPRVDKFLCLNFSARPASKCPRARATEFVEARDIRSSCFLLFQHGHIAALKVQRAPSHSCFSSLSILSIMSRSLPNVSLPWIAWDSPVDLRALEYVSPYDHNLMCAICYCPFVHAVRLPCEHVFCNSCVNDAMRSSGSGSRPSSVNCPSCRRTTHSNEITSMPKILDRMLDDLLVRCPLKDEGCNELVQRCEVQQHIDKKCAYSEVKCPAENCLFSVQRKDAEKQRCLHGMIQCEDCNQLFMERYLESHRTLHCEAGRTSCPDCKAQVLLRDIDQHVESCPEAIFPCVAAEYGCDFISRRAALDQHSSSCALAKLVPFLQKQNERLGAHEAALKSIRHRNSILETSFSNFQETLSPSLDLVDAPSSSASASDAGPFDSTAHHLLCLHESLRDEVSRVSAALSELDARTSMTVVNESMRVKEDISHMNAAIGGMRLQLHWLVNARLQNQQRVAMVRNQTRGALDAPASSTPEDLSGGVELPIRRLSDSTRQETKL